MEPVNEGRRFAGDGSSAINQPGGEASVRRAARPLRAQEKAAQPLSRPLGFRISLEVLMRNLFLAAGLFFFLCTEASAQSQSADSRTLQAILEELHKLRQDLQATSATVER